LIIKSIKTKIVSVPFSDPPKTGFLTLEKLDLLIVQIETKDGIIGTGHLHPLAGGLKTLEMCVNEMLKPLLIGETIKDIEALWTKMWNATFIQGRMGITVMAMSALDIALWDCYGRTKKMPLWKVWSGKSQALPVYGSGCYRGLGHDGMIEKAEKYVKLGFKSIKMQVAHCFTNDEDIANVRDMRKALGDNIGIMIDVNQGWGVEETIKVSKEIEKYNLEWLEEPVMADDFEGYQEICKSISIPVVTGENNFTHNDLLPFMKNKKISILQPDIMRGGYTNLIFTSNLANEYGIKIAPHMFPELSIHIVASIKNPSWLEYMGWYDHLWQEPLLPVNGTLKPSDRPGHGMDFKSEICSF
jgi:L-alanine-DL-glutamate epimerase-like enolase superfamily enzyme